MAATQFSFSEEDMEIDECLGHPRAYAKLCRSPHLSNPYHQGPPFAYIPYILHDQEALIARDLNQLFPIIDRKRKPTMNPRNYVSLLWKQLNHLGNAGFDPEKFRVDIYGNVLYFQADSGSPLAWEIDHWFPCSRGGRTVPSNLRLLQWQVCKRKQDKLEFLIPWWDLQLGVSVNQFLSIFASINSDFRNRAFRWLFSEGENEDLNDSQAVESHVFPHHFIESEQEVGLAPAAIVFLRRDLDSLALHPFDQNRPARSNSPLTARKVAVEDEKGLHKAIQRFSPSISKENDNPNMGSNQYMAIALARDSLKHREETEKRHKEIQRLEAEVSEMKQNNDAERIALQDLEAMLIQKRRRAEKCRRLAESQSSYRALLEKMIRDAMHQSLVYKEHIRLNQAANSALMAGLEAQKAICEASEKELRKKFKQREEIENQMRPYQEHARKRSRVDDVLFEGTRDETTPCLLLETVPTEKKELRQFLEEEHKASEAGISLAEERKQEDEEEEKRRKLAKKSETEKNKVDLSIIATDDEKALDDELQKLAIGDGKFKKISETDMISTLLSPHTKEDEEIRMKIGKGNVDRWLQMLLENSNEEGLIMESPYNDGITDEKTVELLQKMNCKTPHREIKIFGLEESQERANGSNSNRSKDEAKVDNPDKRTGEIVIKVNQRSPKKEQQEKAEGSNLNYGEAEEEKQDKKKKKDFDAGIERKRFSEVGISSKGMGSSKSYERKRFSEVGISSKGIGSSKSYERKRFSEVGISSKGMGSSKSYERKEREEKSSSKEAGLVRCESARSFRPFPASPSMILGMRRGVDCIGKKPMVMGDDDDENNMMANRSSIKTSIKTYTQAFKKAVKK